MVQPNANERSTWVSTTARTPEELETLFEDAVLTRDGEAMSELFAEGAVLVLGDDRLARGEEIAGAALAAWDGDKLYVADPRKVVQARNIALAIADGAITVARRGADGTWRYAIVLRAADNGTEMERSHA
jgi:hypothetical protein